MKADKATAIVELTPTRKLKQARLPFKHIDVSPKPCSKPDTPHPRKRKLSAEEPSAVTKIGRISKENDVINDLVVISDEDSKDAIKGETEDKTLNPLAKMVDMARKKKLQKSKKKTNKKKVQKSYKVSVASSKENSENCDHVEMMDIDLTDDLATNSNDMIKENIVKCETVLNCTSPNETDTNIDKSSSDFNCSISTIENVRTLEDSCKIDKDKNHDSLKELNEVEKFKESDTNVTPKRSTRSSSKPHAKSINTSTNSSLLDESIVSNQTTPKQDRNSSVPNSLDESLNDSTSTAKLTPKQLLRKQEWAKKREEREKEKLEREKKRQEEKEERAKQKHEKEEQKRKEREEKEELRKKEKEEKEEAKKKEKEEKDELKKKEKEVKEKQKELEKKLKEEKEDQRKKEKEAKEEEKRKRQEAQELEKQEQELKKKKAAEAFVNFFVPKQKNDDKAKENISKTSILSSFTIKSDMRLAPTVRTDFTDVKKQLLDASLIDQDLSKNNLYLISLKNGDINPKTSGRTWPLSDKDDDDVMIVEDELPPIDSVGEVLTCESTTREKLRPKLLSFHQNRRPPYWGTWRKTSASITPRRPFGQDQKLLDYDVDSDDDWEEEQEGESIDGSVAGSDDEQGPDEYEVDNEVFVPHGYLSDEEATMDEGDVLSLSPETQKARLKHLEDEFESEMKKPTEKLKPRMYGLLWETKNAGKPEKCVDALWTYVCKLSMIMEDPTAYLKPNKPEEQEKKKSKKKKSVSEGDQQSPNVEKKRKVKPDMKERKKLKVENKKTIPDVKKNQPGINSFLTKLNS